MTKRWLLLLLLLALGARPLFAQATLTETATISDDSGLTLTVAYPAGWSTQINQNNLALASSADAVDALSSTGIIETKGDIGIILYLPALLQNVQLASNAPAAEAVATYLSVGNIESQVETRTDFAVPAASAVVDVPDRPGLQAILGALEFPAGTVLFGVIPGADLDETVLAILQSVTLTAAPPEQIDVTLTLSAEPTVISVPQSSGTALPLALNLPEDWVYRYNETNGLLYLGTSSETIDTISSSEPTPNDGEIGVTIALPAMLAKAGIVHADTPENTLADFLSVFHTSGPVTTDDSFAVPAAHVRVSGGNIPKGGGLAYALTFDAGSILVIIQPGSISPASVADLVHSIQFGAGQPEATEQAQELRQWASSAEGSSQYGENQWSFAQATGAPNTPTCGDNDTAWASAESSGRAVLRVTFEQPVIPTQINIHQTFNPGAIVAVDVGSATNPNKVLTLPNSADPPGNTACPGVFTLNVSNVKTPVNTVIIYFDQAITGSWNEIDAVELVGTPVE